MKRRIILILILIGAIVLLIIGIFYFKQRTTTYTKYVDESYPNDTQEQRDVDNANEILSSSSNAIQRVFIKGKSKEIDSVELTTEFDAPLSDRKALIYAIDMFTHTAYSDIFECYYDVINKVTTQESSDYNWYAATFKFENQRYIAIYNPVEPCVEIMMYAK